MRTVLLTGNAGHLGKALRSAFEMQGDMVVGIDAPHTKDAEWLLDLDEPIHKEGHIDFFRNDMKPDVVICNAKTRDWRAHEFLASCARSCIVNIGSIYGVLGNDPRMYEGTEVEPTPAWYAASKSALIGLTRWQATNLAPVRSNAVCPGGIFRNHSDEFVKRYSAKVPLGRMATEADIVPLIVFLASDDACYITGQIICADGGYSAW